MTQGLSTLAVLAHESEGGGAPPIVWGVGAFVILMVALAVVLVLGKGRGN